MKTLIIDEVFTVFSNCWIDVSAQFEFDDEGAATLKEPAKLGIRFNFDPVDALGNREPLPAACDLTIAGVTPELEPCRYCGETPVVWDAGILWQGRWREAVLCGGCGVRGPVADTESEAVRFWNEGRTIEHA